MYGPFVKAQRCRRVVGQVGCCGTVLHNFLLGSLQPDTCVCRAVCAAQRNTKGREIIVQMWLHEWLRIVITVKHLVEIT